jgi:hypothetical protein
MSRPRPALSITARAYFDPLLECPLASIVISGVRFTVKFAEVGTRQVG